MTRWLVFAVAIYAVGNLGYRTTNAQVRALDGISYVVYPTSAYGLYLVLRPAAYVDAALTGQRSHLGAHPEEVVK